MRGMGRTILDHAARAVLTALAVELVLKATEEAERILALDIKNLEGETSTATVKVAGGSFDVEYHPHAATRKWQSNFGGLQREQGELAQRADDEEAAEEAAEIAAAITEELQKLVVGWELEYEGEPIPVTSEGMDLLSMPMQQALFQAILSDASGGSAEEKKPKNRRSRRGSR